MTKLSSDILEKQFGPTEVRVVSQSGLERTIQTVVKSTDQVLENSKVTFNLTGSKKYPKVHQEIIDGQSIGKAFRDNKIKFTRHTKSIKKVDGSTVIEVEVLVGAEAITYAAIHETYSPEVKWPEVLLIDNYDSFTYNLYQQIASLGQLVKVVKHDDIVVDGIKDLNISHIVISPGPKRPADSGISMAVVREFQAEIPILGVCLGMQCIGEVFGSNTVRAPRIMHGKADDVLHNGDGLFEDVPSPFTAARYHSLVVDETPKDFIKTAWSDDGSLMAFQHRSLPVYGVQFHPESFMTEHGETIMRNFLNV